MELGLADKVVLITGASKGLGRATAFEFGAEHGRLSLCARGAGELQSVAKEIAARYEVETLAVPVDLTRIEEVQRVVRETMARYGRIDVLVNNAGSIRAGSILTKSEQDVQEDWSLKLYGYVRMIREVLPIMIKQKSGRIVNVGGTLGREPTFYGYNAWSQGMANAALMNLTKSMAAEGAPHNILVNAVNPGMVRTPRTTNMLAERATGSGKSVDELLEARDSKLFLGRAGVPEDIAAMITFLASQRATYITGAVMAVDGGNSHSY